MLRKTLALLIRALRVDAREFRPHLIRFGLVGLLLLMVYFFSVESAVSMMGAPGLQMFRGIVSINGWFLVLVGSVYFASAITEEKEERTLGLLKMADVGGLSLLLGKWLPRVIALVLLLAVQLPFTMLAITLGGLTLRQVAAAYVALFAYLGYVGGTALFASVVCRTTASASRLALILLFLKGMIPTILVGLGSAWAYSGTILMGQNVNGMIDLGTWLSKSTVSALTERALQSSFAETAFPTPLLVLLGESLAFFLLAWALFEPCTKSGLDAEPKPSTWRRFSLGRRKRGGAPRRAWQQAIVGKDFTLLGGGIFGTSVRFAGYLGVALGLIWAMSLVFGESINAETVGYSAISWGLGFWALEAVLAAARVFRTEIHDHTWSSLVMLPRSLTSVAWSKIGGCVLGWWPALAVLGIGFLFAPRVLPDFFSAMNSEPTALLGFAFAILQIILVLELTTLYSINLTWASGPIAAPLAIFTVGLSNVVLFTCLISAVFRGGSGGQEALFFMLDAGCVVIVAALYILIGRKLADRAAEGT